MYFVVPPDSDWTHIANLTNDDSWLPEKMREYFVEVERNGYLPPDQLGHGYDGFVSVCQDPSTKRDLANYPSRHR